ncbi:SDR family oxidoreductase [Mucilaginibacter sp. RS28]|uniref:dTDP-4-dehydrorhamnose reductase n=1 Tax=Mucilaginibacter straminoryzae TaxID=2932774 RepID=A0A9X2BAA9_9SPHI|nr:SDR family oxidoreductase [Mucilaginibacter straminoryzae]MCJ8208577.1 SDR family oxidoreductase [Mucilaginibacter straminoryzae]
MEQVKKVLIVGSKGMAGHAIYFYLKENTTYKVVDVARDSSFFTPKHEADISNVQVLEEILLKEKPDFVINCVGLLNQEAESNPDKAILLNSYLPHFIARKGALIGYKFIHISTDCVFSGSTGAYVETSFKDGKGYYAQSKALGEVTYGNNITLRTSIIGPELKANGIGLFNWFMNQTGEVNGYMQAYWTGVTTLELAKAITKLLEQEDITGLHHLVNSEKINKFDLITLFKKVFNKKDINISKYSAYTVDKSLIRTNHSFQYTVPDYEAMIIQMKEWIQNHPHLYKYKF